MDLKMTIHLTILNIILHFQIYEKDCESGIEFERDHFLYEKGLCIS